MQMENEHYPGLFQAADSASLLAQKIYILFQRMYLGSLILGSVVGASASIAIGPLSRYLYMAIAIILLLGLLVLWVSRSRRDDKAWFDCRAIAESVKTLTWRFMMNVTQVQDGESAEKRFIEGLREIREARPDCAKPIAGRIDANASAITEFMKQIRSSSFEKRKKFYGEGRLRDQKSWYSKKARINTSSGSSWFWVTLILQAIAVTIAVIQAGIGSFSINIVPVLTTVAAAVAAWSQMKRHDELAKTYSLAAQELSELEAIADSLLQASDFPQLVEQVEETISREHTMWCARRDVPLQNLVARNDI